MRGHRTLAALAVGLLAFCLYRATRLPGLDFGDTGSFQTMAGEPAITPRDAYPLYFAIGDLVVRAVGGDRAGALNLASAIEGGAACAVIVAVAAQLAGSTAAGIGIGLLFAGSYTFWSQAIIAEVYALHALCLSLSLLLLLRWQQRPTITRLAAFFAVYALGFGNHLSMVLLLPGYTLFLLVSAPGGWRSLFAPRIACLALVLAAAGAAQYAWNIRAEWLWPHYPAGLADALQRFWFDVTKSDWRETMVMRVPDSMLSDRLSMYAFEVRQQFGWLAVLAPVGLLRLLLIDWRRAVLIAGLYAVNVAFAFTYDVGDTHVFYLPAHLLLVLLVGPAVVWIGEWMGAASRAPFLRSIAPLPTALLIITAVVHAWDNYPALDRSEDRRPTALLTAAFDGDDDTRTIALSELNWQVQNGMPYFEKILRPNLAVASLPSVVQHAPVLISDNLAAGRDVTLVGRAARSLAAAYPSRFEMEADPRQQAQSLPAVVRQASRGERYVLVVLKPTREFAMPTEDLRASVIGLTGGAVTELPHGDYVAIAGLVGGRPAIVAGDDRPFRTSAEVGGIRVDVRMESWLNDDTIRRMGFAQVVADRHHTLIAERGVSFAVFDAAGRASRTVYAAGIFAPPPRYLIRRR